MNTITANFVFLNELFSQLDVKYHDHPEETCGPYFSFHDGNNLQCCCWHLQNMSNA